MKNIDVTINITAHKEGYYLYRTLASVQAMQHIAHEQGIKTKVQINLDNSDELTTNIANDFTKKCSDVTIYVNQFGDASASRNFLINKTTTKYTLFVDGDDLFTENFIAVAYRTAENFKKSCIVSAEDIIKFDGAIDPTIFRVESTIEKPGIKSALFEMNIFISQNLVSTEILKKCPYEPNMGNYGFEDWHWNTKVVNQGYEFLVAIDTAFFYRQKPDSSSLLKKNVNGNTVVRPTPLFDPKTFVTLPHDKYIPVLSAKVVTLKAEAQLVTFSKDIKYAFRNVLPRNSLAFRASRKVYRLARRLITDELRIDEAAVLSGDIYDIGLKNYKMSPTKELLWDKMNHIEPIIRLDDAVRGRLSLWLYTHQHTLATTYRLFCEKYGESGFTDIIFVPWINIGGADLAMLDLAKELSRNGRKVLIITTAGIESDWAEKAQAIVGVEFIQSHDAIFKNLDHINIKLFFLRLIQNWGISSMTIMNSAIGFELIERFGHAIRDTGCRVIVHNYAFPVVDDRMIDAFPSLSMNLEKVDVIVTDSLFHRDEIREIYGVDIEKIIELPLKIDKQVQQKKSLPTRRVLFANRISREKQPQVAIAVAAILEEKGISVDIYGAKDTAFCNEIDFDGQIEKTENAQFKGLFSTSRELAFDEYDICFMPSLYEGTPRIVLESIRAGLYIVCSDVGGMPESIVSEYSGVVVSKRSSAQQYADAILNYYDTQSIQDLGSRRKANNAILDKHSNSTYTKGVRSIYHLNKEPLHV